MSLQIGSEIIEQGYKKRGYLKVAEASTHEVKIPWIAINGETEGGTLCILSGVHSLECTPIEALFRLSEKFEPYQVKGKLIIVPVVNVEGYHARSSYENTLDHLNQNRVLPGDVDGSMTKRVAHAVWTHFISQASYVVDAHSADLGEDATRGVFVYKTTDLELNQKMVEMAQCFDVDYIETGSIGGNIGEAVSRLRIPCIMTESGAPYPIREDDVLWHFNGLINVMRYIGMISGDQKIKRVPIDPESKRIFALHGGAWRKRIEVGQRVKTGEALGVVSNLLGETVQEVKAPYDGTITFLRTHFSVNEGDTLLWLTRV